MSKSAFAHLLSPGRIGPVELRNRIVMSPMGSNLAEPDGHVGERLIRYYEARARGGVGLVIVGVGAIAYPAGVCIPNQVAISDDAFLPGLRALASRVHAAGAKIAIQLQHAGKVATRDIAHGRPLLVPSVLPYHPGDLMSELSPDEIEAVTGDFRRPGARMAFHEMTGDDIAAVVEQFAEAADRAKRAGFDGVELHAGHGYLLAAFLSPATNRREDAYGGPVESRARPLVETLAAVRARVGPELAVWCRLDAKEFRIPGGIGVEDGQRAAELAAAAGADAIHVSAYADPGSGVAFTDAPLVHQPSGYVELAEGIQKRVDVPVIAVGRIEPEQADELVRDGRAAFVAMARKLLADPGLATHLAEGRPEDVRPCIYCYRCVGEIFLNRASRCAVNPASGREAEFEMRPAETTRHVLVAGGGPAGLEAARIAALRGHRVTLCEKSERLGGTARLASLVYPPNGRLVEWLERQVRALPVELRLSCPVTPALVEEVDPDHVLVAVGARRERGGFPGAERPEVFGGDALAELLLGVRQAPLAARAASQRAAGERLASEGRSPSASDQRARGPARQGRHVVVGGGMAGIGLAGFLAERGCEVAVIEAGAVFAPEMAPPRRWRALYELRERDATLWPRSRVARIDDEGVHVEDAEGASHRLAADAVLLAGGTTANLDLARSLTASGRDVHALGDCSGVGYLEGAILDATRIARQI